ncbi:MAG: hypothetical protein RXR41_01060 [Candidatus Marsarchaeota archaeon]
MKRLYELLGYPRCALIYGAGGVGKTTVALEAALGAASTGKAVIYGFSSTSSSLNRAVEIANSMGWGKIPDKLNFAKVDSFKSLFELATIAFGGGPDLLVIDTITYAYRVALSSGKRAMETGRLLTEVVALLAAGNPKRTTILLADVQTRPTGEERPVAESSLKYWCDEVMHLTRSPAGDRSAEIETMEKFRSKVSFRVGEWGTEVIGA